MHTAADIQRAVEDLASALGLPVLVEDVEFAPLWWSAQGQVDGHRMRSIMQRSIHPAAAAMVKKLRLATTSRAVIRTPEVPAAELLPRWCLPMRAPKNQGNLLGFLWILDPEELLGDEQLADAAACAELAAAYLAHIGTGQQSRETQRAELLERLSSGPDPEAALAIVDLERLTSNPFVVVHTPARRGGWKLAAEYSVQVVQGDIGSETATSGHAVPLADLYVALQRARLVSRSVAAGARLEAPTWDHLRSWQLIALAPNTLSPNDIHPGARQLAELPRSDLLTTARITLELGSDVTAAAAALHIHRTTLYYRLDRIAEITGVDVRTSPDRMDLLMALRLDAFRSTGTG